MSTLVAAPPNVLNVSRERGQAYAADGGPAPTERQVLVVVLLPSGQPVDGAREPAPRSGWRVTDIASSGRHGADLKAAFQEGLRAGADCLVVGPHGVDGVSALSGLVQPILAERAEIVLPVCDAPVGREPIRTFPRWPAARLFGSRRPFVHHGPLAISRHALEVVPYEANSDGELFTLQLLGQARYFALAVAPAALPGDVCRALEYASARSCPSVAAQLVCGFEFLFHRWGLIESPRLQDTQPAPGRWMITRDNA